MLEIEMRRHSANRNLSPEAVDQPHIESLEEQMLAEPVPTCVEAMERWQFLLDRYAATPDGQAPRIRELIKHALGDIARLKKHQEPKP